MCTQQQYIFRHTRGTQQERGTIKASERGYWRFSIIIAFPSQNKAHASQNRSTIWFYHLKHNEHGEMLKFPCASWFCFEVSRQAGFIKLPCYHSYININDWLQICETNECMKDLKWSHPSLCIEPPTCLCGLWRHFWFQNRKTATAIITAGTTFHLVFQVDYGDHDHVFTDVQKWYRRKVDDILIGNIKDDSLNRHGNVTNTSQRDARSRSNSNDESNR